MSVARIGCACVITVATKMATQGMINGVSAIYKRLLNHRPVIQNEVQFFVKEFEGTRGGNDHQSLKTSVDMTNEVESLLQEIARLSPLLKQITEQVQRSNSLCDTIFAAPERELGLPAEMKQALDADVAEHQGRVQVERNLIDSQAQEKLKQLKGDITRVREARVKLQTKAANVPRVVSSVGPGEPSSITTVPADVSTQQDTTTATPDSQQPDLTTGTPDSQQPDLTTGTPDIQQPDPTTGTPDLTRASTAELHPATSAEAVTSATSNPGSSVDVTTTECVQTPSSEGAVSAPS